MTEVAGIVLAAGSSTRMGLPKQLLPAGSQNLLDRSLTQALQSDLHSLALVLGFRAREIEQSLGNSSRRHPKLRIIVNEKYEEGISASLVAGVKALERDYENLMVLLADMPYVTTPLINSLIHAYLRSGLPLGAVLTGGRRTHPVIVGRRFFKEIHSLKGDTGARHLFLHHPDQVCLVEPREHFDDADLDTMEEYLEFKNTLTKQPADDAPKT